MRLQALFCLLSIFDCNLKQSPTLPVQQSEGGAYLVTFGFGTVGRELRSLQQSLILDTGSDLTWIQCRPCQHCFKQKPALFDPEKSDSYSRVKYNEHACDLLPAATGHPKGKTRRKYNCKYTIEYQDGSKSEGTLCKDKVTLPKGRVEDIYFGCGTDNHGLFDGEGSGILGLGPAKLSYVSQTSTHVFSYCLPSSSNKKGFLTLGDTYYPKSMRYTPMMMHQTHYVIRLVGITVDGQDIGITETDAIIDSGTTLTRLPSQAYDKLRRRFEQKISRYLRAPPLSNKLDICYNVKGQKNVDIPLVKFRFEDDVTVDIDLSVFYGTLSQWCLGFIGNKDDDKEKVIFGSHQHLTHLVVYDTLEKRIGFSPGGCD